jgi:hypothetical protein
MQDIDIDFFRRLSKATTNRDIFECVKIASRSQDPKILKAFVACLHCSKEHRKAISRCILHRIGDRAIPLLLADLDDLPRDNRIRQLLLLCKMGHQQSVRLLAEAIAGFAEIPPEVEISVDNFLANYADDFKSVWRDLVLAGTPRLVLFAARLYIKHDAEIVCSRLHDIANEDNITQEIRDKALLMLSAHCPERAIGVLQKFAASFTFMVALKSVQNILSAEDYQPEEEIIRSLFLQNEGGVRLAASVILAEDGNEEAISYLRSWLMEKFQEFRDGKVDLHLENISSIRKAGIALARSMCPEWASFIAGAHGPNEYIQFCRHILYNAQHPLGLEILDTELKEAKSANEMFRPMVIALKSYKESAIGIIRHIVLAYNTPQKLDQWLRWIRCLK